jgi:hypothetical protein
MNNKRLRYNPVFKAWIALAAFKNEDAIFELTPSSGDTLDLDHHMEVSVERICAVSYFYLA